MKLTYEDHDRTTIVNIQGDYTSDQIDGFRRAISERCENGTHDFVLNISELSFIDSAGLESLLWLQEKAAEQLGQIRLVSPGQTVCTILKLTRLDHQFECYEEITDAIRSLR